MAASELRAALRRVPGIPVLLYHGLTANCAVGNKYEISVAKFREQLEQIRAGGWETARLREVAHPKTKFGKRVSLTFDDGQQSDHRFALPNLREFGFQADFFVNTS